MRTKTSKRNIYHDTEKEVHVLQMIEDTRTYFSLSINEEEKNRKKKGKNKNKKKKRRITNHSKYI